MWVTSIKRSQNFGGLSTPVDSRARLMLTHVGADVTLDINTIREFLAPQDRLVRAMVSHRLSVGDSRAEYTCEWFTSELMNFAKKRDDNNVLLITGPPFCGKSVLSHWITETLQASTEKKPYDVISYHVGK